MTDFRARHVRRIGVSSNVKDVRIVHELDGIIDEVNPNDLLRSGRELWSRWLKQPEFSPSDVLLGLDAGGILPTVSVALASNLPYRLAWKLDLDVPDKKQFNEINARRPEIFVYGNFDKVRVLIVDDEITTGKTLLGLVKTLRTSGAIVTGVLSLIEDAEGNSRSLLKSAEVPLCSLTLL